LRAKSRLFRYQRRDLILVFPATPHLATRRLSRVNKRAVAAERRRTVVGVVIPKRSANPWKKIWENLIQWGDFRTNKNRIEPVRQVQSSEEPSDRFGGRMRGEYGDSIEHGIRAIAALAVSFNASAGCSRQTLKHTTPPLRNEINENGR
jgi:hypothetical protein